MTLRTRFAPSPTGPLHLGHAYSACVAYDLAQAQGGTFLLRIEDIDQTRSRPEWEAQIYDDLHWLGLTWPSPVLRQSDRLARYEAVLDALWRDGLLYVCHCNRRDIQAALSAPQEGASPATGPDGLIYPGTCKGRDTQATLGPTRPKAALRLDLQRAIARIGGAPLTFRETGSTRPRDVSVPPSDLIRTVGDIVLSRRDFLGSYHLSVVLDDADQGITHVVRGQDLFEVTQIHVLLQRLLDLHTPVYHHHRLIRDDTGRRLAKRDDARALSLYRAQGLTPSDVRRMVGLAPGGL